jgi:hypothetical protein
MYAAAATTVVTEVTLVAILAVVLRREGLADAFTAALTVWLSVMAEDFNDGHAFTAPAPRRETRI